MLFLKTENCEIGGFDGLGAHRLHDFNFRFDALKNRLRE